MKLVHSSLDLANVRKILQEGIRPSIETGKSWYGISPVICFTALHSDEEIGTAWGEYHFVLNNKWLDQNKKQFRGHGDEFSSEEFSKFLKELNIEEYSKKYQRTFNQILSLRTVPTEGIEKLIIPSNTMQGEINGLKVPENINLQTYQPVI